MFIFFVRLIPFETLTRLLHPFRKIKMSNTHATPAHHNIVKLEVRKTFTDNKRVNILNHIFMRHISDLMSMGEVAPNLLNKEIEITKVRVTPDFRMIKVYWFSSKDDIITNDLERILENSAGHLQHELSQLQVIGQVPPITFYKDTKYGVLLEIENLFSNINLELKDIETNDHSNANNKQSQEHEIIVPAMQQNVMGFDHSIVMNKVNYFEYIHLY
jgi:ribosome-binding factor A